MSRDVEWRRADIGRCKARGNRFVRQRPGEGDPVDAGRALANAPELRAVANEHSVDVAPPPRAQLSDGFDKVNRSVPRAERAGENHDDPVAVSCKRHGARGARMESVRIGSPLDLQHALRRHLVRQNPRARRHDQVRRPTLPLAPALHGPGEEDPIQALLQRSRIVDDGRVHFEYRQGLAVDEPPASPRPRSCNTAR